MIYFAVGVTKDLRGKIDARELAKVITGIVGGGFGGYDLVVSGGGKNENGVEIESIFDALEKYLQEVMENN